ncbi:MAG: hypothetical protein ABFC94_14030 [Syntrophomonas sp.]
MRKLHHSGDRCKAQEDKSTRRIAIRNSYKADQCNSHNDDYTNQGSAIVGCRKYRNPGMGELVINGGFENQSNPFFGWIINSGVDQIDPGAGDTPHQGLNAARLGFQNPYALIYQDISHILPGLNYQLNFFMSTVKDWGNAPVHVRLQFLDHCRNVLGSPALDILIPQNSLHESYTAFINATKVPAPQQTHFARVLFEINTGADADQSINLDDVSLISLRGSAHI